MRPAAGAAPKIARGTGGEHALVQALRRGEADAFARLVGALQGGLLAVATGLLRSPESAREVVQDTWIAVIEGLDRFEERSSLRAWIYSILVNRARTRAGREWRQLPFSALGPDDQEPLFDPASFEGGRLRAEAVRWEPADPEQLASSAELRAVVDRAIQALPDRHRTVLILRDVEGLAPEEVCNLLGLSETNQRVMLHRARLKVRAALERAMAGSEGT